MAGKITICSKLPTALVLTHPIDKDKEVTIRGLNNAPRAMSGSLVAVPYMTTIIDADFWNAWNAVHSLKGNEFGPLKSGAIWAAKSDDEAKSVGRDNESRKTGLEPMDKNAEGVRERTED